VPIRPYLSGQAFEPDMIRSMSLALERACEEMGLRPGKDDPATRFVAEKIIKFAQRGIRDPDRLAGANAARISQRTLKSSDSVQVLWQQLPIRYDLAPRDVRAFCWRFQ
jgi:hypothetical protein